MGIGGEQGTRTWQLSLAVLAAAGLIGTLLLAGTAGSRAAVDRADDSNTAVLPCKRKIALTAIYRINGKIRFEGVADRSLRGERVRVYTLDGDLVAGTSVRQDGTWWVSSPTDRRRYTWLSKFVAEAAGRQSRWRRLGQAVGIRGRKQATSNRARKAGGKTTIQVKVSGGEPDQLVVGIQTGCSRHEVTERFDLETNEEGVAEFSVPRPVSGEPYAIYRVATSDGWRISPPIVVKPAG